MVCLLQYSACVPSHCLEVELTMVPKERAFLQSERGPPIQTKVTHFTLKASARSSKKVELANATKGA
jgi:hypothetical protein